MQTRLCRESRCTGDRGVARGLRCPERVAPAPWEEGVACPAVRQEAAAHGSGGATEAVPAVSLCLRLLGPQLSDIPSLGAPVSSRLCSTLSHPRGPRSSCGRSLKSVSLAQDTH
ncbi:unnamed protein product [Rangifer tarandus platyrhynchus]|uniref:Uncharacterized protein n=2 Tax=Rangifer tarandus platyrhynchus TaxID=3082113 RepID=A0ACB0FFD4_RANTA|nr:unnamed protein product [Rangifer tarandus platyrhynchus]CAI9711213.1 unnamed protein product [Rangifer tarandus platyrhynchus]